MANLVKLNIDGQDIEVEPGTLILEAARRLDIEIPTFCYDERLKSVGACRMCLVEVEKSSKLVASCATPVDLGMIVKTQSEKVIKARRAVLEFLLINHPLDCPTCDKGGECPLQNLTYKYGPPTSRYRERKVRFQEGTTLNFDDLRIGPEIWLNRNRCIICYKCVRIARDLGGSSDIGMFQRGAFTHIDIPQEIQYANEFSGNTVEYCPVGALMSDSFRYKVRTWLMQRTPSLCWLCPDGCNITVEQRLSHIYRHSARRNDNVDGGFLCDKGRYGFDLANGKDRIKIPQALVNGLYKDISYDEALALIVHRLNEQKAETAALLLDYSITNEESFSAAEYFRTNFPGSTIAISSALKFDDNSLSSNFGLSVTMPELEKADMVIIAGCDLAVEHPIIGLRIKKLINQGVPVYIIGSRRMNLGRFNVVNILTKPGEESLAIDDIANLKNGAIPKIINAEIAQKLSGQITNAKNIHLLVGKDFLDSPNRKSFIDALNRVAQIYPAKLSILPDESNFIGVNLTAQPNADLEQLVQKAEQGKINTLFVAGGNPINIYPNRQRITDAFKKIDYIIYWGAYPNVTADMASLIFPQALPTETTGSLINVERRLQFMKEAYPTDKAITSLIKLFSDIKIEFGREAYYSVKEVFEQIAGKVKAFSGFVYEQSEGTILARDLRAAPDNIFVDTPIQPPADYPFVLTFAKSVYYGASGMTTRSQILSKFMPPQSLWIAPADAARFGLNNNDSVLLTTPKTKGTFSISITKEIEPGHLVLYGFSVENPPNKFMAGYNKPVYAKISKS
jgi:NADH-quinone oxidoreductase subunit G